MEANLRICTIFLEKKNTWKTIWKSNDRKNCHEKFKIDGVKRKTYATNLPPPIARCALLCFYSAASTSMLGAQCAGRRGERLHSMWHATCRGFLVSYSRLSHACDLGRVSKRERERERGTRRRYSEKRHKERERGIEKGGGGREVEPHDVSSPWWRFSATVARRRRSAPSTRPKPQAPQKKKLKKSQQHKTAKSAGRLTKRPQTGWHRQKCSKHMGQMTRGECICLYIYKHYI